MAFESYPTYGVDHPWQESDVSVAASTLKIYLNILPEPLIPGFIADELYSIYTDLLNASPTDMLHPLYLPPLRRIPKFSRDTLLYILVFFDKFLGKCMAYYDLTWISYFFEHAILRFDENEEGEQYARTEDGVYIIGKLIQNVSTILEHISCSGKDKTCWCSGKSGQI